MRDCLALCKHKSTSREIYDDPNLHFFFFFFKDSAGYTAAAVQINFCTLIATGGTDTLT